jgi:hypothetical protein
MPGSAAVDRKDCLESSSCCGDYICTCRMSQITNGRPRKQAKISCFDHENYEVNKFTPRLFKRRVHRTANWLVPPDQYA